MARHSHFLSLILLSTVLAVCLTSCDLRDNKETFDQPISAGRAAKIRPDYSGMVIPPNIAPLNFIVQENGSRFYVKIYSGQDTPIEIFSKKPAIIIPEKEWHKLLNSSRGQNLHFDVFVKGPNDQWMQFSQITNKIANENIDGYLVYRKIFPVYSMWRHIGIFQRTLHNYEEKAILKNDYFKGGCLNCHSFCANKPDKFTIGIRSPLYGSTALLVNDNQVSKIDTKFGYTTWHPSGKLAAYSLNKVRQIFHEVGNESRDVLDLDSTLAYYLIDSEAVKTTPEISRKDQLETYPCWSPDGRYLYYCSAPKLWPGQERIPFEQYDKLKYNLMRISYDLENDKWGQAEMILSAKDTGLSILEPRISPDGRWLLFVMCNYGCFPVLRPSSDLYLMDLKTIDNTGQYKYYHLDINSNESESWHSFSSNSRWIAFSSKRRNGTITRSYLSYMDQDGKVYKPVLLPQKDPEFYDSCLDTYSVPEFIVEPVKITGEKLGRVVRGNNKIKVDLPITMATPSQDGKPRQEEPMYGERE
ncbi:MAG: TolB family protein [Planctomycetota bacterium]